MDYGYSGIPDEFEYEWYDSGLGQLESKFSEITEDLEERYGHLYNESEHCRGIKWIFVDRPPKDYIDGCIEYYRMQLLWDQKMLSRMEGVYEEG
jgi:hypothetical protein